METLVSETSKEHSSVSPKVVGVVASPSKRINTDTLVTRVLAGAESVGAETHRICLSDLEIRPYQALLALNPSIPSHSDPCHRPEAG
jgi:multimeric flavodoxin WrbA